MTTVARLEIEINGKTASLKAALSEAQRLIRETASDAKALQEALAKAYNTPPPKLPSLPSPPPASAPRTPGSGGGGGGGRDPEAAALRQAAAQSRLAAAQGDTAKAAEILRNALAGVNQQSEAAIRTQTQLAALEARLAREQERAAAAAEKAERARRSRNTSAGIERPEGPALPRTFAGFTPQGLGEAAGFAAAVTGIPLAIETLSQFATQSVAAANTLEQTKAVVEQLSGSSERYAQVLGLARENQTAFGGSLAENLTSMQQFLFISNRTGAQLNELNNVAQLLSVINPFEGFEGAGVALSEFFAGDTTSIVERFNLPRQEVNELVKSNLDAAEKLGRLTELLAEQGVTSETLAARLNTTAQTYTQLGVEASTAFTNIGAAAAQAAEPIAQAVAGALAGFNQLVSAGQQAAAIAPQIFDQAAAQGGAEGYELYKTKLAEVNEQLGGIGQSLTPLTEAQFAYAVALRESGLGAEQVFSKLSEIQPVIGEFQSVLWQIAQTPMIGPDLADSFKELEPTILNLAAAGPEAQAQLNELFAAFQAGQLDAPGLTAAVNELAVSSALAAQATGEHTDAQTQNTSTTQAVTAALYGESAAIDEATAGALLARVEADEKARADTLMAEAAQNAAQRLYESGSAGAAAATLLEQSSNKVDRLTAAYYRLYAAQQNVGGATKGIAGMVAGGIGGGRSVGGGGAKSIRDGYSAIERVQQEIDAQAARAASGGGRGGRGGKGGGGKGTKNTEAEREAQQALRAQEQLNQALADAEERYYEDALNAEEEYQQKLLDIQQEYAERQLEAQQDLQVADKQSRFSFYDKLTGSDVGGDVAQSLSAAYEEAFAEAQRMSQEGNAALADDYLALKQRQIEAELRYQEALAAAREKGDKAEVERLQRLAELRKAAEEAEMNRLLAQGDQNVNRRDEQLGEAEQQRDEDLAQAAEKLGDAKEKASEKAERATKRENDALREQVRLLDQIGERRGTDRRPTTPADVPLPAVPQEGAAGGTANAAAAATAAATGSAALVQDPGTIAALQSGFTTLNALIAELLAANRQTNDRLATLEAVIRATRKAAL